MQVYADTSGDSRICDRFGRFDCDNEMWKVPPDLASAELHDDASAGTTEPLAPYATRPSYTQLFAKNSFGR